MGKAICPGINSNIIPWTRELELIVSAYVTDQRVEVDSADLPLDPVESCRKMGSGHKVSGSSWSFLVKLWS